MKMCFWDEGGQQLAAAGAPNSCNTTGQVVVQGNWQIVAGTFYTGRLQCWVGLDL